MLLPLLTIPALGALISVITVYSVYRAVFSIFFNSKHLKIITAKLLSNFNIEELVQSEISKIDWEKGLSPLLQKKMEHLLDLFKQQIPMAAMIITPQLTVKLTDLATPELLKLVPELQTMLLDKIDADKIKERICEKLSEIAPQTVHQIAAPFLLKACICACILGFAIGCIQLAIALSFHS